jgi:hypothetical protein
MVTCLKDDKYLIFISEILRIFSIKKCERKLKRKNGKLYNDL